MLNRPPYSSRTGRNLARILPELGSLAVRPEAGAGQVTNRPPAPPGWASRTAGRGRNPGRRFHEPVEACAKRAPEPSRAMPARFRMRARPGRWIRRPP
jgi:hypothetical protein